MAGVRVIVAVSMVVPGKVVDTVGDHVTVPVNCGSAVIVVTGVAPATGAVTPRIAVFVTTVGRVVIGSAEDGAESEYVVPSPIAVIVV